jgi:dihydropyrimidinase
MPFEKPDLVVRGGTVVTAVGRAVADVAVVGEHIVAIGEDLPTGLKEIDARGRYVLPGGVDTHAHIEQMSAAGIRTADDWESATRSAALGGTTTVLAFAAQHRNSSLAEAVADYAERAAAGAVIDYGFHLMIGNPSAETLTRDLPAALAAGHRSVKVFMSYDSLFLGDEQLLEVMSVAKEHGGLICVHAESHGMLSFASKKLLAEGKTAPLYQPQSHPRLAELDAIERIIRMSDLVGQPVMIFHVSTTEGAEAIRRAKGRGSQVYAETCPQYLFLDETATDRPLPEAAKFIFSPPPRRKEDQEALWNALRLRDLSVVSSDHAPYALTAEAKLKAGPDATFKQIPNGIPGIELRQMLMFDAMVNGGRGDLESFVALTSTNPARLYGLAPRKGHIGVGADADLVVWDASAERSIEDGCTSDKTGFTPYAGRKVRGAPEIVVLRGRLIVRDGNVVSEAGSGTLLQRPAFAPL